MEKTTEQTRNSQQEVQPETTETAAETYIKRRTLTTGETFTGTITSFGYEPETKTLHFYTHLNQHPIRLSLPIENPTHNAQTLLTNLFIKNNDINTSHAHNHQIQVTFDTDIQTCYHVKSNCELDFIETDETAAETHTLTQDINEEITNALLKSKYADPSVQAHDTHPGIELSVTDLQNNTETLTVTVTPTLGTKLTWTLEIPSLTEMKTSPEAIFIENQGGGDPRHIDTDGTVIILHDSDTPTDLNTIGHNTNHNWNLIPPTVYENWCENHTDTQRTTHPSHTTTSLPQQQTPTHSTIGDVPITTAMRQGPTPWANRTSYFSQTKGSVTNSVAHFPPE